MLLENFYNHEICDELYKGDEISNSMDGFFVFFEFPALRAKMCKQSLGYIKIYMSGAVCNKISREKTFENALSNSVDCPLCCHIELNCFMTFDA